MLAAAITPCLLKTPNNPDGALDDAAIVAMQTAVKKDRAAFLQDFSKTFFTAGNELRVSEAQRQYTVDCAAIASPKGSVDCIAAFGRTDFREDLKKMTIPTLIIHGDADGIVPFQASGKRAAASIPSSKTVIIKGGPHGINVSHADQFNTALIEFIGA